MNNSYKTFEVWADEKGWIKVHWSDSHARWISPQGNVVTLTLGGDNGDAIIFAEETVSYNDH